MADKQQAVPSPVQVRLPRNGDVVENIEISLHPPLYRILQRYAKGVGLRPEEAATQGLTDFLVNAAELMIDDPDWKAKDMGEELRQLDRLRDGAKGEGGQIRRKEYVEVTIRLPKPLVDVARFFATRKGQSTEEYIANEYQLQEFQEWTGINPDEVMNALFPGFYDAYHEWNKRQGV